MPLLMNRRPWLVALLLGLVVGLGAVDITTPAAASPATVTGTTTALTVRVRGLFPSYSWSATGPAPVTYSRNDSRRARSVTATFHAAGDYLFTVTVTDRLGGTATSSVAVTVVPTAASVTVSPSTATVVVLVPSGRRTPPPAARQGSRGDNRPSRAGAWWAGGRRPPRL